MADNKLKKGWQDDIRISAKQAHELKYWSKKFGVSEGAIVVAIDQCGSNEAVLVHVWLRSNWKRITGVEPEQYPFLKRA